MRVKMWAAGALAAWACFGCERQQPTDQARQDAQARQQQQASEQAGVGGAGTAGTPEEDTGTLQGTVQSVQANALRVNVPNQGQITLDVDPSVQVTVDGQQASFRRLEPGHEIRASFSKQGQERKLSRIEATSSVPSGEPTTPPQPDTPPQTY